MISTPVLTGMKILVPLYSGVRYAAYHARNSDEVRLTLRPILLKQKSLSGRYCHYVQGEAIFA